MYVRNNIESEAEKHIGVRYKYGGNTPNSGFDCSGFTVYVMKEFGLDLERTSGAQAKMGRTVNVANVKAGDLIYFTKNGKVFHVSLVVDNTNEGIYVMHATSSRGVIKENISKSSYWWPKKKGARNVLGY